MENNIPPGVEDPADYTELPMKDCRECGGNGFIFEYDEDGIEVTANCPNPKCDHGKMPMTQEELEAELDAAKEPDDL